MFPKQGHLLRIFIGESNRHEGVPLHEWILRHARRQGLAGATVLRGMSGFGASSRLHTTKFLRLSADLPIVIEIVDTIENIEAFLPEIDSAMTDGMVTIEKVQILVLRGRPSEDDDSAD